MWIAICGGFRKVNVGIVSEIGHSLGAYLKATVVNAGITILLFVVGFAIAGVPWWPVTGIVCGLINLFPYIGSLLALGLALLIQFFANDEWTRLAAVGGVWLGVQIVDGFILSPRAASKSGVNPIFSIFLVIAASLLFGPIGMLLAVPVTAVLLIIKKSLRK